MPDCKYVEYILTDFIWLNTYDKSRRPGTEQLSNLVPGAWYEKMKRKIDENKPSMTNHSIDKNTSTSTTRYVNDLYIRYILPHHNP